MKKKKEKILKSEKHKKDMDEHFSKHTATYVILLIIIVIIYAVLVVFKTFLCIEINPSTGFSIL